MKIGIFYGSSTGNTEAVAKKIGSLLDAEVNIADAQTPEKLKQYDVVLLGASTWGLGDLQDDWDPLLGQLENLKLEGKKIAFFGTGDQSSYPDTFVDSLGILYEALKNSGAEFIGKWPLEGYEYSESKAEKDGSFVGLPLDEDGQSELTDDRIEKWVNTIKSQIA